MATSGENRAAIIASLCMGRHVLPYRSAARPICADAMDEDKLSASADMAVNKGKEDSNSLSQPDSNVDVASVHAVTIIKHYAPPLWWWRARRTLTGRRRLSLPAKDPSHPCSGRHASSHRLTVHGQCLLQ